MKSKFYYVLIFPILISGCSNDASHLPSPFELPGAILSSAIENATYNTKRKNVEAYVGKHYLAIRDDAYQGGGKTLEGAFDAAGLRGSNRAKARKDFINRTDDTFKNSLLVEEALIQVFSALYVNESSAKDKQINGFDYIEARAVINKFSAQNFEALRSAIKRGDGTALDQLTSALRIQNEKRTAFKQKAHGLYKRIYLEPVVIALMILS